MASGDSLKFTANLSLVPKGRPRVTKRGTFTPKRTLACEADIREAAAKAMVEQGVRTFEGPVGVIIQSYRKTRRRADVDNQAKTVLDAMIGPVYRDDDQVRSLTISWRVDPDEPRVTVVVYSIGAPDLAW